MRVISKEKPRFLSTSKARSKLSAVLDMVSKNGKTVLIGRYGRPLAAMVPIKEYRQLLQYQKYAEVQKAALRAKDPSKPHGRLSVGERMAMELEIELGLY
jgi:prevent-host-death family protein